MDRGPVGRWNRLEKLLYVPPNIDSVAVRCRLQGTGPVWFDDLSLEEAWPEGIGHLVDERAAWSGRPAHPRQAIGLRIVNASTRNKNAAVTVMSEELGDRATVKLALKPDESRKIYPGLENKRRLPIGAPVVYQYVIEDGTARIAGRKEMRVEPPPTLLTAEKMLIVPNFHIDPFWNKGQNEYIDLSIDVARATMDVMRRDPGYNGVLSELSYLVPFSMFYPEYRRDLAAWFRSGRLEGGGQSNEPNGRDTTLEVLIRDIQYGKFFHEQVLGGQAPVSMMLDNFGQIPQWPQLLAKAGFNGCIWGRGNPYCDYAWPGLPRTSRWMGLDGSEVLLSRDGYWRYVDMPAYVAWEAVARENKGKLAKGYDHHTMGLIGCDWTYPNPALARFGSDWRAGTDSLISPTVTVGGPSLYFDWISQQQQKQPDTPLPLMTRDTTIYHLGTSACRPALSVGERLAENAAAQAERWATIANLLGEPFPDLALDKAWRQLIFSADHASRVSSDGSFYNILLCLRQALELSHDATRKAQQRIGERIQTAPDKISLLVFNSLSWTRTDSCEADICLPAGKPWRAIEFTDAQGHAVPFDILESGKSPDGKYTRCKLRFVGREIPSVGYKTYYITEGSSPCPPAATGAEVTIENEYYRLTADPALGGGLTSIYDKTAGRELLDAGQGQVANEVIGLLELTHSPFDLTTLSAAMRRGRDNRAKVKHERGNSFDRLVIEGDDRVLARIAQEVTLSPGVRRIDFRTRLVKTPNSDYLYTVSFPSNIQGAVGVYDEKAGAVARDASQTDYVFRTGWEKSECGLYSCNNWIDKGYAVLFSFVNERGEEQASYAPAQCEVRFTEGSPILQKLADAIQGALVRKGITCTPAFTNDDITTDLQYRRTRIVLSLSGQPGLGQGMLAKLKEADQIACRKQTERQGWCALFIQDPLATVQYASNFSIRGIALYRTLFYLPAIVPSVASSILWIWVLNPNNGLINSLLNPLFRLLGCPPRRGWSVRSVPSRP